MIIDTHTHPFDERLRDREREIVGTLADNGIERIVAVGFDRKSSEEAVEWARRNPAVYAAVGTHPHDAAGLTDADLIWYKEAAREEKVVAVGEIGLDYHYDLSPRDRQREAFERQLVLADEVGLPVVLHIREAYGEALEILKTYRQFLRSGVLLHCYCGSAEMVDAFNRLDCYYAFGGVITFRSAKKEAVLRAVPAERLLLETDCPYMTPEPYRGKTNEPKYVNLVADKAAEILQVPRERLIEQTTENARRLFFKMK